MNIRTMNIRKIIIMLSVILLSLGVNDKKGAAVSEKSVDTGKITGDMFFSLNDKVCFDSGEWIQKVYKVKKSRVIKTKDPYAKACKNAFNKVEFSELDFLKPIGWVDSDKVGYIRTDTTILKYNKNGCITKVIDLKKKCKSVGEIAYLQPCGKNRLLCYLWSKGNYDDDYVNAYQKKYYVINTTSGKIFEKRLKVKKKIAISGLLANNKKNLYFNDSNSKFIYKVNINSGRIVSSIKKIGKLLGHNWKMKTYTNEYYNDTPYNACACDEKNVYIKTEYGLFKWNGKRVDKLISGVKLKSSPYLGEMFYKKGKLYFHGECEKGCKLFVYPLKDRS